ncbi:MAG: twin-arginine translocase TatA/TatE family subunit [Spirochaetaceae bacterium]|jgi:sec-independent protein translocase protein TatA|nr:twin-arginine translocase TatA/TatE family subunit [Spirochaetaceae bacterium]
MRLGIGEIIVIVIVAFALFGGASKLSGLGKALGKSIREFRDELKDGRAETGKKPDDDSAG